MNCKILGILVVLAGPSAAQDVPKVDTALVESCFANAGPGEYAPQCLGAASNQCQQQGYSSTLGITGCINAEVDAWDTILNREYKAIRADFSRLANAASDTAIDLNAQLLTAQRAWIAYRDAECMLAYARWQDGSLRGIVHANCMMGMTAHRAIELRDMKGN